MGGKEFTLPPGLPALVLVALARTQGGDDEAGSKEEKLQELYDCFEALFGDRTDEIMRLGLQVEDLELIMDEAYGEGPGESSASESSS